MPVLRALPEHGKPFASHWSHEMNERYQVVTALLSQFQQISRSAEADAEQHGLERVRHWLASVPTYAAQRPLPELIDTALVIGSSDSLFSALQPVSFACSAPLDRLHSSASDALASAASQLEQAHGARGIHALAAAALSNDSTKPPRNHSAFVEVLLLQFWIPMVKVSLMITLVRFANPHCTCLFYQTSSLCHLTPARTANGGATDGLSGSEKLVRVAAAAASQRSDKQPVAIVVNAIEQADSASLAALIRAVSFVAKECRTEFPARGVETTEQPRVQVEENIQKYYNKCPSFALIFQLQSSAGVLQSMLPSSAAALLEPRTFQLQTTSSKLDHLVAKCFLHDSQPLPLSLAALNALLARFEARDPSADGIVRAVSIAFANHCSSFQFAEHACGIMEDPDNASARSKALARRALGVKSDEELQKMLYDTKVARKRWRASVWSLYTLMESLQQKKSHHDYSGNTTRGKGRLTRILYDVLTGSKDSMVLSLADRIERLEEQMARELAASMLEHLPHGSDIRDRAEAISQGTHEGSTEGDGVDAHAENEQLMKRMPATSTRSSKSRIMTVMNNSSQNDAAQTRGRRIKSLSASLASIVRQLCNEATATDQPPFKCLRIGEDQNLVQQMNPSVRTQLRDALDAGNAPLAGVVRTWRCLGGAKESITVQDIAASLLQQDGDASCCSIKNDLNHHDMDVPSCTNKTEVDERLYNNNKQSTRKERKDITCAIPPLEDLQQAAALIAQSALDLRIMGAAHPAKRGKENDAILKM